VSLQPGEREEGPGLCAGLSAEHPRYGAQQERIGKQRHLCHLPQLTRCETNGGPIVADAQTAGAKTCGQCHAGILKDYLEGVHGQDFAKGVRDVPVCTDCHGEHQILAPQDKQSKFIPSGRAHLREVPRQRGTHSKYNLPEKRLRTFQGSFHGLASAYGETKVANCASCHGFHNIRPSSDRNSPIHPAHLPQTCSQCHAGAGEKLASEDSYSGSEGRQLRQVT
jgi:nitrate/TMAO reductase-like tetraheme cytochrome c subunit